LSTVTARAAGFAFAPATLALASAAPTARADPASPSPVVVAAMGDSLSDPRVGGGKYLDVLPKRCPRVRFDSYGKGGEMVNQMRHRFTDDIFGPGKPAYTQYAAPLEDGLHFGPVGHERLGEAPFAQAFSGCA
jgi:hypothetical protein